MQEGKRDVQKHLLLEGDGMPHNVREALAQHGLLSQVAPDVEGSGDHENSSKSQPEPRLSAWSPSKARKSALKLRSELEQQKHLAAERYNYVETWNGVRLDLCACIGACIGGGQVKNSRWDCCWLPRTKEPALPGGRCCCKAHKLTCPICTRKVGTSSSSCRVAEACIQAISTTKRQSLGVRSSGSPIQQQMHLTGCLWVSGKTYVSKYSLSTRSCSVRFSSAVRSMTCEAVLHLCCGYLEI